MVVTFLQISHELGGVSSPVSRGPGSGGKSGSSALRSGILDGDVDAEFKPNVSAVDASYRYV